MRRLPTPVVALATLAVVLGTVLALASPVSARSGAPAQAHGDAGRVSIIKVEGLIDPVMADFIDRSITEGEDAGVVAVVIQLDSSDSVVSDERLVELADAHPRRHRPRHACGSGPAARAPSAASAQLAGAADRIGIAPGARLGKTGPLVVPEELLSPAFLAAADRLENGTVNAAEANELGITASKDAPVIGEFLIDLPGFEVEEVKVDGRTVSQPVTTPVFSSLPVQEQLFHTVASPPAAYLLLLIGLSLIIFEFFTAGVGVAGLVGAGCFVMSCYGLAVLPVRPWALALLVIAMFGLRDRRADRCAPGVVGHRRRSRSSSGRSPSTTGSTLSWITLLVGIVGVDAGHGGRHAGHGPHPLLHAHDRAGVDDRRGGRGGHHRVARRRRARPRRPVAGPHQPGHADRPARRHPGGRGRRPAARGRAPRGRRGRLPGEAARRRRGRRRRVADDAATTVAC